jgi:cytidylate kinase
VSRAIGSPIAIDGPAASGKGTIARRLATYFGYAYLDTGALYRAVAVLVRQAGHDIANEAAAVAAAQRLAPDQLDAADLKAELRSAQTGKDASIVAAMPEVRAAILQFQRDFAASSSPGCILDGRDIGTIVCPDAPHKLFITARADIRAERRWKELVQNDPSLTLAEVLHDIEQRDARDQNRATAPLRQAEDALLLDTSNLSIEGAVKAALDLLRQD